MNSDPQPQRNEPKEETERRFRQAGLCPKCGHHGFDCTCEQPPATDKQEQLISEALDNAITALGQVQKGTARQFLRSAINAALKAERQRRAEVGQNWEMANDLAEDYKEQLLSAQAAIAEHNRLGWNDKSGMKITVDLSALERHDKKLREEVGKGWLDEIAKLLTKHKTELSEVRKPLVDALQEIADNKLRRGDAIWMRDVAKDALAKVVLPNAGVQMFSPDNSYPLPDGRTK